MGEVGNDFGRSPQELLNAFGLVRRELFRERASLPFAQLPRRSDLIDQEAIAAVGRHAAGARMGLNQIAELFQARHLVADRCRRDVETRALDEVSRADGLTRADVLANDRAEDRSGPLAQVFGHGAMLALDHIEC